VQVWDIPAKRLVATTTGIVHSGGVTGLSLSADGEVLATGDEAGRLRLWNAADGKERKVRVANSHVSALAFDLEANFLIAANRDGTVQIWDWPREKVRASLEHSRSFLTMPLAVAPGGKSFAVVTKDPAQDPGQAKAGSVIRLYELPDGKPLPATVKDPARVMILLFARDGQMLCTGNEDATARCWDISNGKEITAFKADKGRVLSLVVSPDGRTLVAGTGVWDEAKGQYVDGKLYWWELPGAK
jgi:WD40 repeat protein